MEPRRCDNSLSDAGIHVVQTPRRAPNANAYAERFVRSIKEECLDRMIPLGERHFRRSVAEFVEHYHRERNHQGLANQLIAASPASAPWAACIDVRDSAECSIITSAPRDHRVGRDLEHYGHRGRAAGTAVCGPRGRRCGVAGPSMRPSVENFREEHARLVTNSPTVSCAEGSGKTFAWRTGWLTGEDSRRHQANGRRRRIRPHDGSGNSAPSAAGRHQNRRAV